MTMIGQDRERAELLAAVAGSNSVRDLAEALFHVTGPGDTDDGFIDLAEAAITVYLSASLPTDAAELVGRWKHRGIAAEATLAMKAREAAKGHDWVVAHEVIQCDEIVATASLIQSQAARIAELEDMVSRAQLNVPDHYTNWHSDARSLLNGERKG